MAGVTVSGVSKQFGGQIVLDDVSLQINPGEVAGLIGLNGAGKTTLFRLIAREIAPDMGTITYARGAQVAYFRQEQPPTAGRTVYDEAAEAFAALHALETRMHDLAERMSAATDEAALKALMASYERLNGEFLAGGGHSARAKIAEVLGGLGFSTTDYDRALTSLSGGERCRAALARLLLEDKPILLLDEPTNHLDIDAVRWLENYLSKYRGSVLLVSHDRYLLDRVCTRIVELSDRKLTGYSGNYSTYAETKAVRELTVQRQYEQDQEFIAKERAYIAKHLAGQRSQQAKGRRTRLERRLDAGELVTSTSASKQSARIQFAETAVRDAVVLRCDELSISVGEQSLVRHMNLQVSGGERIGITGPNGTGKTTLLRTILGELPAQSGRIEMSPKLTVGYYAQAAVKLDPTRTILDEVRAARSMSELQARSYMAQFLFRGNDVFKTLGVLSGGEQSRVRLATLILSAPDILVLDEPTNHLDIPSREALEEALTGFNGTVIAVSHDRYFLDQLADRLLVIRPEGHRIFTGNYSEYVAQLEAEAAQRAARAAESSSGKSREKSASTAGKSKGITSAKGSSATKSNSASARAKDGNSGPDTSAYNHLSIEQLEEMVMEREIKLAEMQQRFGDPALYKDPEARAELEEEIAYLSEELSVIDAAWHERAEGQ